MSPPPDAGCTGLEHEECRALLAAHDFGRLALVTTSGEPLIRPINYVYVPATNAIAFRTDAGTKLFELTRAAHACFEIDGYDDDASAWSVIAAGTCEHVTRPQETAALDALNVPHHPALQCPEWFRLRATRMTGRRVPPLPPAGP